MSVRFACNPQNIGCHRQALRSFLCGSLVATSLIYIALTESVVSFFAASLLILIGIALFTQVNMSLTKRVYLFQNVVFSIAGGAVSLGFFLHGLLPVYLIAVCALIIVTWFRKFDFGKILRETVKRLRKSF